MCLYFFLPIVWRDPIHTFLALSVEARNFLKFIHKYDATYKIKQQFLSWTVNSVYLSRFRPLRVLLIPTATLYNFADNFFFAASKIFFDWLFVSLFVFSYVWFVALLLLLPTMHTHTHTLVDFSIRPDYDILAPYRYISSIFICIGTFLSFCVQIFANLFPFFTYSCMC